MNLYIELLGRILVQKLLLINLYIHRAVKADFGVEIIAGELIIRAIRADSCAKFIANEIASRAVRADFNAEIIDC